MKYVQVKDSKGTCTIQSRKNISTESEFLIKALCGLQIMCIDKTSAEDPRLHSVIEIISDSMKQITALYSDNNDTSDIDELFK